MTRVRGHWTMGGRTASAAVKRLRVPVAMSLTARRLGFVLLTVMILIAPALSSTPAETELPGEELTDRQLNDARRRVGRHDEPEALPPGAEAQARPAERSSFDRAMATWHAPGLSAQMAADEAIIPFGKGGLFVPKFTETNLEPDIEVFDMEGHRVGSWESGNTIILEPGEYKLTLGSGSVRQRIVKNVRVDEGRTIPVIPDWSGLVIDVVDEQGMILRGEYELVRIDEFDPYGRGYGASIELGETVRSWILKPGTYKILGVGEGYNTLTNFVTVRLLPGELTNFLLIQDPDDFRIRGGGTVHLTPTTRLTSNWRFGANVGANVQLNIESDHQSDIGSNAFTMGFLFDTWLLYRKRPVEWSTRLRLDESVNIIDNSLDNMINSPDRLQMSSIFIWRVLSWLGPYARAEFNTKFFETKIRRQSDGYFSFVGRDYVYDEAAPIDTSQTFTIEPGLSPAIFELGAGVNADLSTRQYLELRARLGFGSTFSHYASRYRVIEHNKVVYNSPDSMAQRALLQSSTVLYPENRVDIFEVGPQMSLSAIVRIGSFASAEGEVKLFAPIMPEQRLTKPDLELSGTLSWRLSRILNLDYTYRQTLKRPAELDVPVHTSSHGIWLRLHYSSR